MKKNKEEKRWQVFLKKITKSDTNHLRKMQRKLWDRWIWDTGSELDKQKIDAIDQELHAREEGWGRLKPIRPHNTKRKWRKRKRDLNLFYFRDEITKSISANSKRGR